MIENRYISPREHGEIMREKIREYMVRYISRNGYPPSVREIAAGVGLSSPSTVQSHLLKMYKNGMIETDAEEKSPRAYRVRGYKFAEDPVADIAAPQDETDKAILDAVISYILRHGYSPSYREVGEITGLSSTSTVFQHVAALEGEGILRTGGPGSTRAIKVQGLVYIEDPDMI